MWEKIAPSYTSSDLGGSLIRATSYTSKSRDHEDVRVQKKASKGRPKTPSKSCSVVTNPQV